MSDSEEGLVSGPPHQPTAPTAATPAADEQGDERGDDSCDHDWTVVNRDENRLIDKCARCGALRRE